jgi:nucleoside 2-deoxyribosyltransferase
MADKPLRIYLAGELFSAKHILGNAVLGQAIWDVSEGRYVAVVPQDMEPREFSSQSVRDHDLRTMMSCDVGLFHYDGPELDSGTVVEFMFAKFADLPAVLLRTDFRHGGDQFEGGDPWNLMTSFFPRTRSVVLNAMDLYHAGLQRDDTPTPEAISLEKRGVDATMVMIERVARDCIDALDSARAEAPVLPRTLAPAVYEWLAHLPGFKVGADVMHIEFAQALVDKQAKGLL